MYVTVRGPITVSAIIIVVAVVVVVIFIIIHLCILFCFLNSRFKMPGSVFKKCISCQANIGVACKVCKQCQTKQPTKARLAKKLQNFEGKKEKWVKNIKKNKITSHVLDEASILVCI